MMIIAIPCEQDSVLPYSPQTDQFMVYKLDHGRIVSAEPLDCTEAPDIAPEQLLISRGVDVLLCRKLSDSDRDACERAGLMIFSGVIGSCEASAKAFADGSLV